MPVATKSSKKKSAPKRTPARPADGARHRIFGMAFPKIHAAWLNKVERKGRTRKELDEVITWLTGYTTAALQDCIAGDADLGSFIDHAPAYNPAARLITGMVCGVRVEEVAEPSMRKLRQLDKLVDELAHGKAMEKILRR